MLSDEDERTQMKLFARPDSPHLRGLREENYKAKLSLNSFLVLHNFSAPGTGGDWASDLLLHLLVRTNCCPDLYCPGSPQSSLSLIF